MSYKENKYNKHMNLRLIDDTTMLLSRLLNMSRNHPDFYNEVLKLYSKFTKGIDDTIDKPERYKIGDIITFYDVEPREHSLYATGEIIAIGLHNMYHQNIVTWYEREEGTIDSYLAFCGLIYKYRIRMNKYYDYRVSEIEIKQIRHLANEKNVSDFLQGMEKE